MTVFIKETDDNKGAMALTATAAAVLAMTMAF